MVFFSNHRYEIMSICAREKKYIEKSKSRLESFNPIKLGDQSGVAFIIQLTIRGLVKKLCGIAKSD